jgi:hypothetical protein
MWQSLPNPDPPCGVPDTPFTTNRIVPPSVPHPSVANWSSIVPRALADTAVNNAGKTCQWWLDADLLVSTSFYPKASGLSLWTRYLSYSLGRSLRSKAVFAWNISAVICHFISPNKADRNFNQISSRRRPSFEIVSRISGRLAGCLGVRFRAGNELENNWHHSRGDKRWLVMWGCDWQIWYLSIFHTDLLKSVAFRWVYTLFIPLTLDLTILYKWRHQQWPSLARVCPIQKLGLAATLPIGTCSYYVIWHE